MDVLWLDDTRNPNPALYKQWQCDSFRICRNYKEFVSSIRSKGLPDVVYLDHDLGTEETGYTCASWLVDYCSFLKIDVPIYYSQSANPAGKENILSLLKSYHKFYMEELEKKSQQHYQNPCYHCHTGYVAQCELVSCPYKDKAGSGRIYDKMISVQLKDGI